MRFLDKHSGRDKRLLVLEREAKRLRHAQDHAPVIPLEHPYQRGWEKFYVLEERVAKRPDAADFRAMLALINRRVYSRTRDFVNRCGHVTVLRPRIIPEREWMKLAWPARRQRFFGYGHWRLDDQPWTSIKWRPYLTGFKLVHLSWLREEIQPHLITHQRVELPEVRSRLAEIEAQMEFTQGWHRLDRLHGRRQWWRKFETAATALRSAHSLTDQLDESFI
jgi:hypothetical protein